MSLTNDEKQGIEKVMNIFKSIVDEHGEEILMMLDKEPEMKVRVLDKVERILKAREEKNLPSE